MYEKTDIKKASTYVYERKWKLLYNICMQLLLTVHAHQEFVVAFGLLQTVFYEVHGFYRIQNVFVLKKRRPRDSHPTASYTNP